MTEPKVLMLSVAAAPNRPMRFDRGTQVRLVNPDVGAEKVDVHINELNVDSGPGPYHYHARVENVYIVLDGTVQVVIEGKRHLLKKDDVVFIPPGVKHAAGNGGTTPARVIEIYAPAGDDFHVVEDAGVLAEWEDVT